MRQHAADTDGTLVQSMARPMRQIETCLFHCFFWVDACFSVFLRILGCARAPLEQQRLAKPTAALSACATVRRPMLVVAANGLIGFVTYMYLTVLAPNYLVPVLGTAGAVAVVCVGLFILFNILFNYWSCVLTRPGWPGDHLQHEDPAPPEEPTAAARFKKTCRRCHTPKPPRTHCRPAQEVAPDHADGGAAPDQPARLLKAQATRAPAGAQPRPLRSPRRRHAAPCAARLRAPSRGSTLDTSSPPPLPPPPPPLPPPTATVAAADRRRHPCLARPTGTTAQCATDA